jgi:RHS repeat-associated protein
VGFSLYRFTGKERDAESGNDYFDARYYASSMGRFMSPDPAGPWFANAADPQSWNMYAYGRNNPLINVDPTGLDCIYFGDTSGTISEIDHGNSDADAAECAANSGGQWVNGYTTASQMDYNSDTDSWNVASSDQNNVYYTTITQADPTCTTNCQVGYSSSPLNNVNSTLAAGSMSDFLQWLPANGVPNSRPNAQYPLSPWLQAADMQLLGSVTNYCGPNGAGVPVSGNDWACAGHDYSYNKIGANDGQKILNGVNSIAGNGALNDADRRLLNNVDNSPEGLAIRGIINTVNLYRNHF